MLYTVPTGHGGPVCVAKEGARLSRVGPVHTSSKTFSLSIMVCTFRLGCPHRKIVLVISRHGNKEGQSRVRFIQIQSQIKVVFFFFMATSLLLFSLPCFTTSVLLLRPKVKRTTVTENGCIRLICCTKNCAAPEVTYPPPPPSVLPSSFIYSLLENIYLDSIHFLVTIIICFILLSIPECLC